MTTTVRTRLAGTAVAIGLALTMTLPATSAAGQFACAGTASNAPDGRVGIDGVFAANHQYPNNAISAEIALGEQAVFTMKWKNRSDATATIKLREIEHERDPGMSVRYLANGTDVTRKLRDGGNIKFTGIAANASTPGVLLVIKNKSNPGLSPDALSFLAGRYAGSPLEHCDSVGGFVNP